MVNNDLTYGNFCILLHRYFSLPEKWKADKKEYFSQPRINFFYCCATFSVSDSVCNMFVISFLCVFLAVSDISFILISVSTKNLSGYQIFRIIL